MTLTIRMLGLELLMLEITTEDQADAEYDHDVVSTAVDSEPCGAMGFTTPGVEVDE